MKFIFAVSVFLIPLFGFAKLQVAATTTDVEALVKAVAKDRVDVFSVAKGTQDPHQIEAKPSFMVKFRHADLVIAQGLELEAAWLEPLIQGARNPKLQEKSARLELAPALNPIEIATGNVSRAQGDVHPGGNPHFQLDPIRLGQAAQLISIKLGELDPSQKDFYKKNADEFQKLMEKKTKDWKARIKKSGVKEIVTYHKTFSYFCDRFEIKCQIQLEPKPGIPPTASHILSVINEMKERHIHLVLIENLYEDTVGEKIKQAIPEAIIRRVAVSVHGEDAIDTSEQLIEKLVSAVEGSKR